MKYIFLSTFLLFAYLQSVSQIDLSNDRVTNESNTYSIDYNQNESSLGSNINLKKGEPCATQSITGYLHENPKFRPRLNSMIEDIVKISSTPETLDLDSEVTRFIIPVVFHLVSCKTLDFYSTDQNARDALKILNEDFKGITIENTDYPNDKLGYYYSGFNQHQGSLDRDEYSIDFRLAQYDPNGNTTTGINMYVFGNEANCEIDLIDDMCALTNMQNPNDASLNLQWAPDKYLNIYIVYQVEPNGNAFKGFTTNPFTIGSGNNCEDAVVLADFVTSQLDEPDHKHIITHEVGHWLGLEHIWGHSQSCNEDDFSFVEESGGNQDEINFVNHLFNDTPNSDFDYNYFDESSCGSEIHLCEPDPNNDFPYYAQENFPHDMWSNYMNYGPCIYAFSKGQIRFMNAMLKSSIANRNSLHSLSNLESIFNCIPPLPTDINYEKVGYFSINLNAPSYLSDQVRFYHKDFSGTTPQYIPISTGTVYGSTPVLFDNLYKCTYYTIMMEVDCVLGGSTKTFRTERTIYIEAPTIAGVSECIAEKQSNINQFSNSQLKVYPNPTKGIFTLSINNIEKIQTIFLTDLAGRNIDLDAIQKSINNLEFNASHLENGYYILTVISKTGEKESVKVAIF